MGGNGKFTACQRDGARTPKWRRVHPARITGGLVIIGLLTELLHSRLKPLLQPVDFVGAASAAKKGKMN
jgi:hypothetical protein